MYECLQEQVRRMNGRCRVAYTDHVTHQTYEAEVRVGNLAIVTERDPEWDLVLRLPVYYNNCTLDNIVYKLRLLARRTEYSPDIEIAHRPENCRWHLPQFDTFIYYSRDNHRTSQFRSNYEDIDNAIRSMICYDIRNTCLRGVGTTLFPFAGALV